MFAKTFRLDAVEGASWNQKERRSADTGSRCRAPVSRPDHDKRVRFCARGLRAACLEAGVRLHDMTRHLLGLFAGVPGARLWRRHLATEATKGESAVKESGAKAE